MVGHDVLRGGLLFVCAAGMGACGPGADFDCDDGQDSRTYYLDEDGDGYGGPEETESLCTEDLGEDFFEDHAEDSTDCDDSDDNVHPGKNEACNHVDDDCDGEVDEGLFTNTYYVDSDGDGFGDPDLPVEECKSWDGLVRDDRDCDDGDAEVHPGVDEVCNDVDDDCDGLVDEGAIDARTWYADADQDGFGDVESTREECDRPDGYTDDTTDCDDTDPAVHPEAEEVCHDATDNDCDGLVDDPSAADAATWYEDADCDGYGSPDSAVVACEAPEGHVGKAEDCNDNDSDLNPDTPWYADADGDGYGDADVEVRQCEQPSGYVDDDEDCDDTDPEVNPDATEMCNGVDDDCDGSTDGSDAADVVEWCVDDDGDGYGDASLCTEACSAPSSDFVEDGTDCDDTDGDVNPGASEVCDEVDNDCDGLTDDDDASLTGATTWYEDADGDGYGDTTTSVSRCEEPSGYVDVDGDCDDTDDTIHPDATEYCDGVDDDCDGDIDAVDSDYAGERTWYADDDGDGYGDPDTTDDSCTQPSGYVKNDEDCDDADSAVNPDATEVCGDGVDDDCDGGPSGCGLDGSYVDSDFDAMYEGEASGDQAGYSVASAGDVDDDGYTDLLVGAPYNDNVASDAGIVYVVLGGTAADVALGSADALLEGVAAYDGVGWSPDGLSGGGDVDGDGYGDILVGTGYNDDAGYSTAGAAYLVSGPPSDMELDSAGTIFYGDAADEYFGWSTSIPDDLDGDGYADMVIGAFLADDGTTTNQGEVYVFYGDSALSSSYDATDADTTFSGEATKDRAGWASSGGGDVDGDGVRDLAIGANNAYLTSAATRPGAAYVVVDVDSYSGTSTDLADVDARLDGEDDGDNAGYSVDIGGDADGDGYADLLVGAYMNDDAYTDAGKAYFVSGSNIADMDLGTDADTEFLGVGSSSYGTYAGACVAILPDTNGDGYDEVAVGSMNADGSYRAQGQLYLFLGPVESGSLDLGSDPDAVFNGSGHSDWMGFSVAGLEDFDGDGLGDVLVGAIGEDSGGSAAGAAYLMLGTGF